MNFVCECGFRAELSAEKFQRLAASGGRVKCPKCGKRSTLRIPNETADEPAQVSTAQGSEIEDLLGLSGEAAPNEQSQQSGIPVESAATFSPTKDTTVVGGKWHFRLETKDYFLIAAIGCNLVLSLLAFGFPLSRVDDVSELRKRITELDAKLSKSGGSVTKTNEGTFDVLHARVVTCQHVFVTNAAGKPRIMITHDETTEQTSLTMLDSHGERLSMKIDRDGTSCFRALDKTLQPRTILGVTGDATSYSIIAGYKSDGTNQHMFGAE